MFPNPYFYKSFWVASYWPKLAVISDFSNALVNIQKQLVNAGVFSQYCCFIADYDDSLYYSPCNQYGLVIPGTAKMMENSEIGGGRGVTVIQQEVCVTVFSRWGVDAAGRANQILDASQGNLLKVYQIINALSEFFPVDQSGNLQSVEGLRLIRQDKFQKVKGSEEWGRTRSYFRLVYLDNLTSFLPPFIGGGIFLETSLDKILPLIVNKLISDGIFTSNNCYLTDDPEHISDDGYYNPSNQYCLISVGDNDMAEKSEVGGGRFTTFEDQKIIVSLWNRWAVDQTPQSGQMLTSLTMGILKQEQKVINSLSEYFPQDSTGNIYTVEGLRLISEDKFKRSVHGEEYGVRRLTWRCVYQSNLLGISPP